MSDEIIENFKKLLLSDNPDVSSLTLTNYISDLRHFIHWYEKTLMRNFKPEDITTDIVTLYKETKGGLIENGILDLATQLSESSIKRHISSLRKYFTLLNLQNSFFKNPFDPLITKLSRNTKSNWRINEFKEKLIDLKATDLTVKNYLSDISNFTRWYEENLEKGTFEQINNTTENLFIIDQNIIDSYKKDLLDVKKSSPRTINRKFSSLRKYLEFGREMGFIKQSEIVLDNLEINITSNGSVNQQQDNV